MSASAPTRPIPEGYRKLRAGEMRRPGDEWLSPSGNRWLTKYFSPVPSSQCLLLNSQGYAGCYIRRKKEGK